MGAGTSRVKNDPYAGVMHGLIYVSFVGLALITATLSVDDYLPLILGQDKEHLFLTATPTSSTASSADIFGIMGLVGIAMATSGAATPAPPSRS